MFGLENLGNYDDRKIDRYETDDLTVSTCKVLDSRDPFETAISHPEYNNSKFIVVETYLDREAAQEGHNKWVKIMTSDTLPDELRDVGTSDTYELVAALVGTDQYTYKRGNNDN